jgi:S1-C subfamily serine protease
MADAKWTFPEALQPKADEVDFNLEAAMDAMVQLRSEVPAQAFTAGILGTERTGNGVVIREDGLILTIGYLITEASAVWLKSRRGKVVPAHPLGYDQATGLGLVMPLGKLELPVMPRGSITSAGEGDEVYALAAGGRGHALKARIVGRREFAGYWEYVLDEALFTVPAHPQWGGAALLNQSGQMIGLGSLLVQDRESLAGEADQGNMFVPIDLLAPIEQDLLRFGRVAGPVRPWIGIYVQQAKGHLVVSGLSDHGPAARAGIQSGDVIVEVQGQRCSGLAELFRRIWACGPAGVEISFTLARKGVLTHVRVCSIDRNELMFKPSLH